MSGSGRERVLKLIDEAFKDKAPRGAAIAVRGSEFEVHIPAGLDWRRVDRVYFRDCEQIFYLSPTGFVLYLPGFLRCAVESVGDETWGDKVEDVCYHLTRYDESSGLTAHQEKQFRALTPRQCEAVASALRWLEREECIGASAALDSHWRQFLPRR